MISVIHDATRLNHQRFADRPLLTDAGTTISHREFYGRAQAIAAMLDHRGVARGDRVVVHARSGIDVVAATMGILMRGCSVVPLNVALPTKQLDAILSSVEPNAIIADLGDVLASPETVERYCAVAAAAKISVGPAASAGAKDWTPLSEALAKTPPGRDAVARVIANDLAFINFTSGTTGAPKGVMVTHQSICSFMNGVFERFDHNEATVTISMTPPSFDPFLTELVPSMMGGGRVVILRNPTISQLLNAVATHGATNFGCGPSFLSLIAEMPSLARFDLRTLTEVYFGHENCPLSVIRTLQKALPEVQFINGWGTTETYGATTFYCVPKLGHDETHISVGTPLAHQEVLLLDEGGAVVDEVGQPARAYIRGNTLMAGYWKFPAESQQRFRPNPAWPFSSERIYDTGDLMKLDESGNLIFLGRADSQSKVRGFRVDLDNIQHVINSFEIVHDACVFTIEAAGTQIVAGVVSLREAQDLPTLRAQCKDYLHSYEQPARWLVVAASPRNANGKLDRASAKRLFQAAMDQPRVPPRNGT